MCSVASAACSAYWPRSPSASARLNVPRLCHCLLPGAGATAFVLAPGADRANAIDEAIAAIQSGLKWIGRWRSPTSSHASRAIDVVAIAPSGRLAGVTAIGVEEPRSVPLAMVHADLPSLSDGHLPLDVKRPALRGKCASRQSAAALCAPRTSKMLEFRARRGSGRHRPTYPWQSQSRSRRRPTALPVHACSGHVVAPVRVAATWSILVVQGPAQGRVTLSGIAVSRVNDAALWRFSVASASASRSSQSASASKRWPAAHRPAGARKAAGRPIASHSRSRIAVRGSDAGADRRPSRCRPDCVASPQELCRDGALAGPCRAVLASDVLCARNRLGPPVTRLI